MDNGQNTEANKTSSTKTYITIIAFLAALIVLSVGAAFLISGLGKMQLGSPLSRADKYLEEKNYDLAVTSYREALQQDPKNVAAYKGIVEAYIALGKNDAALHMLEKGYEKTGDEDLEERMEKMQAAMKPVTGSVEEPEEDPEPEETAQQTPRQRQVELLEKAYNLMSQKDYDGMCNVDGSDEADLVIAELKGDHVTYIPNETTHGTGTGCGVYKVGNGYFFYYGDFVDGERRGHGVSYWYNGSGYEIYDGEWMNDAPNGFGTSGQIWEYGQQEYCSGNFVDGLQDGDFTLECKDDRGNTYATGSYTVNYGIPEEATDALEQFIQEVEADMDAGATIDYDREALYDAYQEVLTYGEITIYAILDDGSFRSYYRYDDRLGALGYR